jgi:hypothetical protein
MEFLYGWVNTWRDLAMAVNHVHASQCFLMLHCLHHLPVHLTDKCFPTSRCCTALSTPLMSSQFSVRKAGLPFHFNSWLTVSCLIKKVRMRAGHTNNRCWSSTW